MSLDLSYKDYVSYCACHGLSTRDLAAISQVYIPYIPIGMNYARREYFLTYAGKPERAPGYTGKTIDVTQARYENVCHFVFRMSSDTLFSAKWSLEVNDSATPVASEAKFSLYHLAEKIFSIPYSSSPNEIFERWTRKGEIKRCVPDCLTVCPFSTLGCNGIEIVGQWLPRMWPWNMKNFRVSIP